MGPKLVRELEDWEATQTAMKAGTAGSDGVKVFVEEGRWAYANLQAHLHDEPVDPRFSTRKVAKWLRFSRRSRKDFGRKALHGAIEQPEQPEWVKANQAD
jgi:hypothetical protein